MGLPGEGQSIIAAQIQRQKKDYIQLRASNCGWSASQLIGAIIDRWLEQGAPSVNKYDRPIAVPNFPSRPRHAKLVYWKKK